MRDDDMRSESVQLKLSELLDANARFDLAARGTTNHCPMALVALAEMGASPTRLQAFFDMWEFEYALSAPPVDAVIARYDWVRHLGDRPAFGALRLCFLDWIADAGPASVITTVLQEIPFAPATQAFHSLIRLAYGIEAGHDGEIASGLASLISSHLPIEVRLDDNHRAESVATGFDHVAQAVSGAAFPGNSITARLRAVTGDARFANALLAPPGHVALLDDLARATIEAYWRKPNFTLLHTVTATRAARTVFALLDNSLVEQLLPPLWVALNAAYAIVDKPAHTELSIPQLDVDWRDVCQMAIVSNDDHVIKMTYTCLCEDRRDPSPLYLASAARLVEASRA
jgi:hypothetical protein